MSLSLGWYLGCPGSEGYPFHGFLPGFGGFRSLFTGFTLVSTGFLPGFGGSARSLDRPGLGETPGCDLLRQIVAALVEMGAEAPRLEPARPGDVTLKLGKRLATIRASVLFFRVPCYPPR